ncbi:MAG: hypothetical protein GOVbin703_20 [Prokaryotic dsDNA virus sp.]|nr:MAG: hypothetical protein GOVbin703_20 [Prokaryotic dsDNA virus sp.]
MKLIMENWRGFVQEAKKKTGIIDTIRGKEEVEISYELGNWFIYKSYKGSKVFYFLTHKPSGKAVPSKYYSQKYGFGMRDIKALIQDVEQNLDLPDLSSEEPSMETLVKLADFISGRDVMSEIAGKDAADALKKFSDNAKTTSDSMAAAADAQKASLDAATKSSDSFKEFANSISTFSDKVSDNAEQSDEMLELFTQLKDAGLGDFIEKIGDLEPLGDFVEKIADDGQASGELIAQLVAADIKPEEFVEGITKMQEEFAKFKEDTEKKAEEDAAAEEEQERRLKDIERAAAEQEMAAQGAS